MESVKAMRIGKGASALWRWLFQRRIVRALMPQWAVVVEATPDRARRNWPPAVESVVVNYTVWARTIEEAEGLAQLAAFEEGLVTVTADAKRIEPCAAPSREPRVIGRTRFAHFESIEDEPRRRPPLRRENRS